MTIDILKSFLKRHGIPLVLLLVAIICYAVGFRKGSMLAVVLGMMFELGFWFKMLRTQPPQKNS
jgi:hypothetical protein